jgi:hypothetical protein
LDHIAVVVVVRRLNQEYLKSAPGHDIAFGLYCSIKTRV